MNNVVKQLYESQPSPERAATQGELERMNTIIQASASVLDIQELTTIMLTALRESIPFDYSGIELLNADGDTFSYFAPQIFVSEETKSKYADIPTVHLSSDPPDSLISSVFKEKRTIFLRKTIPDDLPPYQQAHFAITPWVSLLMLPMETMGRMIGCVVLSGKQEFDLDEADIASIERFVQQFTVAFANAKQFYELQSAQMQIEQHLAEVEAGKQRAEAAALETEMVELFVRIINREKEFEPLLKTILYQIGYIVPSAEKATVMVYQPESDDFRFVQVAGYDFEEFKPVALTRRDTLQRWMTQEQCVSDGIFIVRSFSRVNFETVFSPPTCALALRLEVEGELAGLLFLDNFKKEYTFSADDIRRVEALREHINSAFAKALSLQRLRTQRKQLQESYNYLGVLSDIARDISSSLVLETVLTTLYKHIHRLMDVYVFKVGLCMDHPNVLRFDFAVYDGMREQAYDIAMDDSNSLAVQSVKTRSEIYINDLNAEIHQYSSDADGSSSYSSQSLMYIPLLAQERVVGVISVQSQRKNAYSHYHRDMLRSIASNTVSALLNAESYSEIRRQQDILESQAAEIELINTELSEHNVLLERSERLLEEQARNVEIANTELHEKNLLLEQMYAEKNDLLGVVAHDLKNPLASVVMSVELLQRHAEKMAADEQRRRMDSIRTVALRMSNIVDHLLSMNSFETGSMRPSVAAVNISSLVGGVVAEYRERAAAKNISLHCKAEETLVWNTDRTYLHEIAENLLSNAIKYTPLGKNVFVRVHQSAGVLRIEVQDEGPGLSEEDHSKLFGKFARLSAQPTGGEHSTGLGLNIVKKMVEALSGKVWCETEYGMGATFIVELPANSSGSEAL